MAGVVTQESAPLNNRVVSMWSECGIQFRSNLLLKKGAKIVLHEHSYPHIAMITRGTFDVSTGESVDRIDAPARLSIPAGVSHGFTRVDDGDLPGEVLCMWGE